MGRWGGSQGRTPGGGASRAEFIGWWAIQEIGVLLWVLGNALIRGKLARNNLNSVNYRSLSMKYEPASMFSSFVLYFNDWTGINRANQTRISEANHFFDHPKSKIQILHIKFTNYHQLETKGPQILFLCFILISVIGFLIVDLELKMEGQVKSLWVWLD